MLNLTTDRRILRTKCEPVSLSEGLGIATEITKWLRQNNKRASRGQSERFGAAAAAPQFGIPKQVAVLFLKERSLPMVNPRITSWSTQKFLSREGCLSLPKSLNLNVYRHVSVSVECENWPSPRSFGGTPKTHFDAAVVQHEIAHLHGLLINDFVQEQYPIPSEWWRWVTTES
jgi:peptide deformylase